MTATIFIRQSLSPMLCFLLMRSVCRKERRLAMERGALLVKVQSPKQETCFRLAARGDIELSISRNAC